MQKVVERFQSNRSLSRPQPKKIVSNFDFLKCLLIRQKFSKLPDLKIEFFFSHNLASLGQMQQGDQWN